MEQMTMRSVDLDPFESNFGSPAGGRCKSSRTRCQRSAALCRQ
ncbi:hypothetical protein V1290_000192 [Bradyrhizobium sp. AZCC 1578]